MPERQIASSGLKIDPESLRSILGPFITDSREQIAAIEKRRAENHQENGERRHKLATEVQALSNSLFLLTGRVDVHDAAIRSMIGDGAGQGGVLNDLRRGLEEVRTQLASNRVEHSAQAGEILAKVALIEQRVGTQSADTSTVRRLENWQAGWKGVLAAIGICATLATLVGGIVGALWAIFNAMGHR